MAFVESHLEALLQRSALVQLLAFALNGLIYFAIGMAFLGVFNRRKSRNRSPSERAAKAFRDLQVQVMQANRTLPAPLAGQLDKLFNDVARTRAQQLWIGANPIEVTSWMAVWLLGLLTHLAVAAVHFDKPKAGAVALALVALATVVAFLVARHRRRSVPLLRRAQS